MVRTPGSGARIFHDSNIKDPIRPILTTHGDSDSHSKLSWFVGSAIWFHTTILQNQHSTLAPEKQGTTFSKMQIFQLGTAIYCFSTSAILPRSC